MKDSKSNDQEWFTLQGAAERLRTSNDHILARRTKVIGMLAPEGNSAMIRTGLGRLKPTAVALRTGVRGAVRGWRRKMGGENPVWCAGVPAFREEAAGRMRAVGSAFWKACQGVVRSDGPGGGCSCSREEFGAPRPPSRSLASA